MARCAAARGSTRDRARIARAQFGWPLAPPALRRLSKDLWELRASLPSAGEALVALGFHAGELIALKAVAEKPSPPRAEEDASPASQSEEATREAKDSRRLGSTFESWLDARDLRERRPPPRSSASSPMKSPPR